uniref:MCM10 OB-fold domain-containing protein n=1 Tax=Esox lucius TaxID=8010 RepID=A0A3P9A2J8_ESOLU
MDCKMADCRLIRLSQLPERLLREKLEGSDWVSSAVLFSIVTPQSNSSGKTFSIWSLSDLHDLEEHWKTEPGTVLGILNPMRPIDGFDGVRPLSASFHYSQHAELQSSFSGKVKGKTNNLNERLCQTGFYYSGLSSTAASSEM